MGHNYDIVVNTTGTLSCINDNNWSTLELYRDEATDPACKIEIVKGSVYLSGLSSGDQVMGCLSCDGCNLIMPEGASFRGAPNRNAGDQDLLYDVFLDEVDPIGFPNLYSTYINTNTNARVPAGTVQISYPPVPYPTPEEYNTAATSDNMGAVASLCMVVITASAGYVLLRILQKKNGVIVNV